MLRALDEYDSGGLQTLIPFHKAILRTRQWADGETCRDLMEDTDWLKSTAPEKVEAPEPSEEGAEIVTRDYKVEVSGQLFDVKVIGEAVAGAARPGRGGVNRRSGSAVGAAGLPPRARRCPRRCRARCSKSPSPRGRRSPRATWSA